MLLPPPGSTHFPYTTLYRSPAGGCRAHEREICRGLLAIDRQDALALSVQALVEDFLQYLRNERGQAENTQKTYAADRKSTRLNSSHVKISYAVFCLKKKKTI